MAEFQRGVMVAVSIPLLAQLEGEWSRPCQVSIERQPDGTYTRVARSYPAHVSTELSEESGKVEP